MLGCGRDARQRINRLGPEAHKRHFEFEEDPEDELGDVYYGKHPRWNPGNRQSDHAIDRRIMGNKIHTPNLKVDIP